MSNIYQVIARQFETEELVDLFFSSRGDDGTADQALAAQNMITVMEEKNNGLLNNLVDRALGDVVRDNLPVLVAENKGAVYAVHSPDAIADIVFSDKYSYEEQTLFMSSAIRYGLDELVTAGFDRGYEPRTINNDKNTPYAAKRMVFESIFTEQPASLAAVVEGIGAQEVMSWDGVAMWTGEQSVEYTQEDILAALAEAGIVDLSTITPQFASQIESLLASADFVEGVSEDGKLSADEITMITEILDIKEAELSTKTPTQVRDELTTAVLGL